MRNRGFVTFTKASNASCALVNRKKFAEFFVLSPADTWNQPDYYNMKHSTVEESSLTDGDPKLLEILNEDCLLHVISFLDVLDILSLKKVSKKFSELGDVHLRSIKRLNFTNIKSSSKLTFHEAKLVVRAVGSNIAYASINSEKFYSRRVLSLIPKYLTNLKYLHLTGFKLEDQSFWDQMSKILIMLETLDLSDNSEINENFLKSFKKLQPRLKKLDVSNSNVNGNFLKMIPHVEWLNISGCGYITGKQLIKFVVIRKSLKSLNIGKCPNIYGKDVNEMLKNVPQLEMLSLNNYYVDDETSRFVIPSINPLMSLKELTIQNVNYPPSDQLLRTINLNNCIETLNISYGNLTLTSVHAMRTMKHLKKLIINFKNSVPEDFVDYLMELEKLEELHFSCCSYISPANVLRLMVLRSLKFLDISRCYGFTNEFIIHAVKTLKETQPRNKFLIRIGQTEINQNAFNDPEVKACRDYFQLCWKTTRDIEHDYDIDEENNKIEKLSEQEVFSIDGKEIEQVFYDK